MENIQNSLQKWMNNIEEKIRAANNQDIQAAGDGRTAHIDHLATKIEHLEARMHNLADTAPDSEALKLASENLANTERVLSRYENRLAEMQGHTGATQTSSSQDWHPLFLTALEAHQKLLQDLKSLTEDATNQLNIIPKLSEITRISNSTHDLLQEIRYEINAGTDKGIAKLDTRLSEVQTLLGRGQDEILKTITDTGVIAEGVYGDITRSYEIGRAHV
jgi:hypothetical protein